MAIKIPENLSERDAGKLALDSLVQRWIDEAKAVHTELVAEYNDIDTRLNSEYNLSGFTKKATAELERLNDPTTGKTKSLIFASANRERPNHESVLGDYVAVKRKLSIKGRTPKDRNRAKVLQQRLSHIEDVNMMATKVIFTSFDECFSKGTAWADCTYSESLTKPVHKFKVEAVSARDILVDPVARGLAFETSRYRIRRMRYELEDAREKFTEYPFFIPSLLAADTEYDEGYNASSQTGSGASSTQSTAFSPTTTERYCTIYKLIFWQFERDYFMGVSPESQDIQQIDREQYEKMQGNPETEKLIFAGPLEERYYLLLWNRKHGVFHIEPHKIGVFSLVPLVNIHTLWRFWPYGDIKVYENLQDLLDMLITIFLENARKTNEGVYEVDEDAWSTYQAVIEKAIREGGAAPGLKGVHTVPQVNQALAALLPMVIQWIQDSASKHSASMGELPSRQIAKDTVLALIAKDRTGHGRKDVMVDLFLTQLAKVLIKMIMMYDKDPDFIPITDAQPNTPEYIPINQVWSEAEYLSNLAHMANLPLPEPGMETPQEAQAFTQQLAIIKKKFEQENEVIPEPFSGFRIVVNRQEHEFKPEELAGAVKASGLNEQDVFALYKPEEGQFVRYHVNEFTEDADLSIEYGIDTDYRNDPKFQLARAQMLRREGIMSRRDFAEEVGMPNAEAMIERADAENQMMQVAKELTDNPELMQQVMAILQQVKSKARVGKNGGERVNA